MTRLRLIPVSEAGRRQLERMKQATKTVTETRRTEHIKQQRGGK